MKIQVLKVEGKPAGFYARQIDFITKRLKVSYHRRPSYCIQGRFGGGWNYSIGIQVGEGGVILNCFVFMILIKRTGD